MPQGAGRGVATDNLVAIGVHGEGAAEMIEGLQQFLVKITAFGQGGNQAGRCMSLGQDEAVTAQPVRIGRVVPHDALVQQIGNRGQAHRGAGVAVADVLNGVGGQDPGGVHRAAVGVSPFESHVVS